jgi:hypothetical protein
MFAGRSFTFSWSYVVIFERFCWFDHSLMRKINPFDWNSWNVRWTVARTSSSLISCRRTETWNQKPFSGSYRFPIQNRSNRQLFPAKFEGRLSFRKS